MSADDVPNTPAVAVSDKEVKFMCGTKTSRVIHTLKLPNLPFCKISVLYQERRSTVQISGLEITAV